MDSIAGLPERKSEVANLTWNEFGMQSLVLGNGEGLSYKRDRRNLSKGQEDRQTARCAALWMPGKEAAKCPLGDR